MSDTATTSPRARRRVETTAEIVDAAWRLARRDGLPSVALRDLGREVGLKAQSLYAYFDSKSALYDAMFRQGHEELAAMMADWPADVASAADPRAVTKRLARAFVDFCTEDPVRYQLLFQRVIPGWEPSPASYALAVEQLGRLRRHLASLGMQGDEVVDLWTAVITGLTDQQISNDPGGDRWSRLVDRAVDLFFDQFGIDDAGTDPDQHTEPGAHR